MSIQEQVKLARRYNWAAIRLKTFLRPEQSKGMRVLRDEHMARAREARGLV